MLIPKKKFIKRSPVVVNQGPRFAVTQGPRFAVTQGLPFVFNQGFPFAVAQGLPVPVITRQIRVKKIKKLKNKNKRNIKNASIILTRKNKSSKKSDEILLLFDRRGYWVTPGGGINRNERACDAAKREFEEEVGDKLPDCYKIKGYNKKNYKTRVYLCRTNQRTIIFKPNREISHYKWVSIKEIKADKKNRLGLRGCVRSTLLDVIKEANLS